MNSMKQNIKRVFWMIALAFFLVLFYMAKLAIFDAEEISKNSYNPRLNYVDASLKRGNIKDNNGQIIVQSVKNEDGTYTREYLRARMAAHITGYSSVGKTGIEAAQNFELQSAHNEILQRVKHIATGDDVIGNDVVLTIDMDIQSIAGDLLGDEHGAVVVMEPSTGRILALQAYPDFDPNTVKKNWEELKNDKNSSLLNRAAQGLYPPGSTFKVVTALAAMQSIDNWESLTYTCTGEEKFQDKIIHCFNNKAHGEVDMKKAMEVSCNTYFGFLGKNIGAEGLRQKCDELFFNTEYPFTLAHSKSLAPIDKNSSESELVETAIGQGKTVTTPLHMAMIASAIANDGLMMEPYIVNHIEYSNGKKAKLTVPKQIGRICTAEEALLIQEMMAGVVSNGTGGAAKVKGVNVAGKTGTAENSTGNDHSWFIGFAPIENPKIVVVVMLENANQSGKATPIAGKVLKAALEKYEE